MSRPIALVTGASSGIGAAFARVAAGEGYDLVLTARRGDRLVALAGDLKSKHGAESQVVPLDLSAAGAATALWEQIGARPISALVNNAGYSIPSSFVRSKYEDQARFLDLMVAAPTALCHFALPGMLARGSGRIINISSITAFSSGGKGHTLYPAAKSYLVKFSQSLSAEVASKGVNVTAVCPGFVNTEFQIANAMADKTPPPPKFMLQTPEEIAAESWRRNARGVEVVVPGLLPKFAAAFLRYAPEQLVTPLTRRAAEAHYIGE